MRDATAGDPVTGLLWTRKTSRKISRELQRQGYPAGPDTVRRLLHEQGYRLRANRKRLNKRQDPERDRQMRYLVRQRRAFRQAGFAVISMDAKQRELVGNFKNPGRTYRRTTLEVLESDYPSQAEGVAIPYGIFDVARNTGFVVVGVSHHPSRPSTFGTGCRARQGRETPEFAVAAVRRWWMQIGRQRYRDSRKLLIQADCGGANGNRCWLWKLGLQRLADEIGLTITVTHLPTGASKWNPIEHKLFCHLEANWAGQPLIDYETILKFIRTTRTTTGLRVRAHLDRRTYPTGLKITADQKMQINLTRHRVRPQWNYTIKPHEPVAETAK